MTLSSYLSQKKVTGGVFHVGMINVKTNIPGKRYARQKLFQTVVGKQLKSKI